MAKAISVPESDERILLLNSILQCPHRDLDQITEVHKKVQQSDPLFYARLAAWHSKFGESRGHNEVFTGLLCLDPFFDNRETGLALLRALPPYMKVRVKGLIKGKKVKIRKKLAGQKIKVQKGKTIDKVSIEEKIVGLKKRLPHSFKTEIIKYLTWLQSDDQRFDDIVLSNFKAIQTLYASLQFKPCDRAIGILFENNIPEDSKLNVLKEIMAEKSPAKKAELIIKYKIPYLTAVGLIKKVTPSILTALISQMTPQQALNNISSLKEQGVYDNPDLKSMVMEKLKKAETSNGVSGLKAKIAKKSAGVEDTEIGAQLDRVADESIKKHGTIKMPTGIIIDISGSMDQAIVVGKNVAAMVSGATTSNIYVIVTDTMGKEIKAQGSTMTDWERAFRGINPNGATSIGAGVDYLQRMKYYVEQIILITDEGENRSPRIGDAIKAYKNAMNITPKVVVLKVEASGGIQNDRQWIIDFRKSLTDAVGDYSTYEIPDDDKGYYALPGLIPLLSQKSKLDLLYEIMEFPLPVREPFEKMFEKGKKRQKKAA